MPALEDARKKGNAPSAEQSASGEATAGGSRGAVKSAGPFKFPMPKLDLRALFDYHFTRKKRWKPPKPTDIKRSWSKRRRRYGKRLQIKVPLEEQKRRYDARGYQFPFVEKLYKTKDLPLKLVCFYEQGALEGYFRYIKMLKYEHHLKKSLSKLDAADELENECLESRKYKYMDDDGPLSPIAETNEEDSDEEDIGVKIVEFGRLRSLEAILPQKRIPLGTALSTGQNASFWVSVPGSAAALADEVVHKEILSWDGSILRYKLLGSAGNKSATRPSILPRYSCSSLA